MKLVDIEEKIPFLPLINSSKLVSSVKNLPQELWDMSDGELKMRANPTKADYLIKVNLWNAIREVEHGSTGKMSISMVDIYKGVTRATFHNLLKSQFKIAWLIRPIIPYEEELDVLTTRFTERMWEIAEMPMKKKVRVKKEVVKNDKIKTEYGYEIRYDTKAAELILKAYKEVNDRSKGMAVQRQLIAQVPGNNESSANIKELDDRIAELQSKLGDKAEVIEAEEVATLGGSGEEAGD